MGLLCLWQFFTAPPPPRSALKREKGQQANLRNLMEHQFWLADWPFFIWALNRRDGQLKHHCNCTLPAHIVKTVGDLMSNGKADATIVQIVWTVAFKENTLKN